jgi:hypothetical protein
MQKNGGKMKTITDKMIPKWIKERRKQRKQKDYAMRIFIAVAIFIVILGTMKNCTYLINS